MITKFEEIKKLNIQETAAFDVDPQKTFTPLMPKELPVVDGHLIVDELLENHKLAKVKVVSRDCHSKKALWLTHETSQVGKPIPQKEEDVDVYWPSHAILGTDGWDLLEGLPHPVKGYDFVVNKGLDHDVHPYGACYHDLANKKSTGVIEYLKFNGIKNVIVGGLAMDFCVKSTCEQLLDAGFDVYLNYNATKAVFNNKVDDIVNDMIKKGIKVFKK